MHHGSYTDTQACTFCSCRVDIALCSGFNSMAIQIENNSNNMKEGGIVVWQELLEHVYMTKLRKWQCQVNKLTYCRYSAASLAWQCCYKYMYAVWFSTSTDPQSYYLVCFQNNLTADCTIHIISNHKIYIKRTKINVKIYYLAKLEHIIIFIILKQGKHVGYILKGYHLDYSIARNVQCYGRFYSV